jgi:hypothetical protein
LFLYFFYLFPRYDETKTSLEMSTEEQAFALFFFSGGGAVDKVWWGVVSGI